MNEGAERAKAVLFFEDLPIQVKAFAASAVLLICLFVLGSTAYVTLDKSENNLHLLSSTILPKQSAFALMSDNIVAMHMKIFRYVSWASNGVSATLLRTLNGEITSELRNIDAGLDTLSERSDLSSEETSELKTLISKWREYEASALDTIEVGSTDAAMATMMLGQTDENFTALASEFKRVADSVAAATNKISEKLYTDAAQKKVILAVGVIISLLLSIFVTILLSRSIVAPIQAVTNVMQRLSSGDTEVAIRYRGRGDEIGRMVEAISIFRNNTIEMRAMEIQNLEKEKRNNREIGEARARLTDAIETISEGFSLYDANEKLVVFNTKYKTLFAGHADVIEAGTTFEAIVRAAVDRGMIDDAEGRREAWLAERIAQHKNPSSTHIQRRSDGRWVQISERKTAENGVVATYADITELKGREAELAAARDAAEAALRQLRTAQDRLVQTQKLASLGQLTAGIAHEIKNPLNFVNNFSSLSTELLDELQNVLKRGQFDEKTGAEIDDLSATLRANLRKIEQHGKRADSIVKNMLLHSRDGSGEHRPMDINAIVEESLTLAYHGARAGKQGFNITLERSFDPAAGEVDLFPQEITRVLLNIISNGFYAAGRKAEAADGGYDPVLRATTKSLGDRVEIRIRDNGTGIPSEVKDKMFNPFFTTKPPGEGTGLGLSLTHDIIVKQHAGLIEVDTQPGEFTEFCVVLPRTAASTAKRERRA